jgi:hypothetical protein
VLYLFPRRGKVPSHVEKYQSDPIQAPRIIPTDGDEFWPMSGDLYRNIPLPDCLILDPMEMWRKGGGEAK